MLQKGPKWGDFLLHMCHLCMHVKNRRLAIPLSQSGEIRDRNSDTGRLLDYLLIGWNSITFLGLVVTLIKINIILITKPTDFYPLPRSFSHGASSTHKILKIQLYYRRHHHHYDHHHHIDPKSEWPPKNGFSAKKIGGEREKCEVCTACTAL